MVSFKDIKSQDMYGCVPCGQAIDVPEYESYISFGMVDNTELKVTKVVTRHVCE